MGKKKKKINSKEAGLEIGLHFFKFFLKSEYLHYGFFSDGLAPDISNLKEAQEKYAQFLISRIPEGVNTILDVGCGSGKMAETLLVSNYSVDCVSPGILLTDYVRNKLGEKVRLYHCKFQDIETEKKYDLIMFSESFQYIPMQEALDKAAGLINPGGYILISDFFKTNAPGKSPLGGGHKFAEWEEIRKQYSLNLLKEQDITAETAPTIDIVNAFSMDVLNPSWKIIFMLAEDRFPFLMKIVKWKYKKKLQKMQNKHFKGERNGANFRKYKKYMFYLFQELKNN